MEHNPPDNLCSNLRNYPNPFNPTKKSTNLSYVLTDNSKVTLEIYTVNGGMVWKKEIANGEVGGQGDESGVFNVIEWDGTNLADRIVASGAYILKLQATSEKEAWQCEAYHLIGIVH
jgi:flagellar hook assembly protein FlgD